MNTEMLFDVQDLKNLEVEGYPYHTATVGERFMTLPRKVLGEFEKELAKMAGWSDVDNKTTYRLTEKHRGASARTIYISFSDFKVSFGRTIKKR